ncbi:hypothetical protein BSKO_13177 [Bryopsis sp. KO-2023]|nr:hypothetical protein BSKO_13177 [Bryopsis sp. KO-2023]
MPIQLIPPQPAEAMAEPKVSTGKESLFAGYKSRSVRAHLGRIYALCWNKNGDKLASASHDETLKIWSCDGIHPSSIEQALLECRGNKSVVANLAWSPVENDTLVSISADCKANFWDARSGNCVGTVNVGGSPIYLAWSPSAKDVAVVTKDDVIRTIDVRTRSVHAFKAFDYEINDVRWTLEGDHLLSLTGEGNLEVLRNPSLECSRKYSSHGRVARYLDVDPQGIFLATAGDDATLTVRSMSDLSWHGSYYEFDSAVRSIGFSHDASFLAFATEDEFIEIVEVEEMESVHEFKCRTPCVSIAWHPKESVMAYIGEEGGTFSFFSKSFS